MPQSLLRILMLATVFGVVLAAQSYTFTSTWTAPWDGPLDFAGKRIGAVVISADESLRMSGEEALARAITAHGPEGVAAYRVIPREELEDPAKAQAWFERTGIAGVATMRLVSVEKEKVYSSVAWTTSYYQNFANYYGTGWQTVTLIGSAREDTIVAVETMLYEVTDGKLLWASVSESTNPRQVGTFIEGLVDAVVEQLQGRGLIRRTTR